MKEESAFSFPVKVGKERVRSAITVKNNIIAGFSNPFEVMERAEMNK